VSTRSDEQCDALFQNEYEGEMKDGKKHGKGTMDYASGTKYTGDWVDNNMTSQGVYIYADGNRYEIKCSQSLRSPCASLKLAFVLFFRDD
jgi:hypothetical protein